MQQWLELWLLFQIASRSGTFQGAVYMFSPYSCTSCSSQEHACSVNWSFLIGVNDCWSLCGTFSKNYLHLPFLLQWRWTTHNDWTYFALNNFSFLLTLLNSMMSRCIFIAGRWMWRAWTTLHWLLWNHILPHRSDDDAAGAFFHSELRPQGFSLCCASFTEDFGDVRHEVGQTLKHEMMIVSDVCCSFFLICVKGLLCVCHLIVDF